MGTTPQTEAQMTAALKASLALPALRELVDALEGIDLKSVRGSWPKLSKQYRASYVSHNRELRRKLKRAIDAARKVVAP